MTGGVIAGGWNFVVAAYVVTFGVLAIYVVSLITRFREESARASQEQETK